jgi:hypothetical protein
MQAKGSKEDATLRGGKFYINPHRDRARHIGSRFRPPVKVEI